MCINNIRYYKGRQGIKIKEFSVLIVLCEFKTVPENKVNLNSNK